MAITEIDVANMALGLMGQKPIASFTEASVAASVMNLFFRPIQRSVLESAEWGFAIEVQALAALSTTHSDFVYRYSLPSDYRRAVEILRANPTVAPYPYRIRGKTLVTDQPNAELIYIRDSVDPNEWTPLFINAFAWSLAAHTAVQITGKDAKATKAMQMFMSLLPQAKAADAGRERAQLHFGQDFINARS